MNKKCFCKFAHYYCAHHSVKQSIFLLVIEELSTIDPKYPLAKVGAVMHYF